MRAGHLSRAAVIVFGSAAVIIAGLALRDPTPFPAHGELQPFRSDPKTMRLRECSVMGKQALKSAECRAVWAAQRERFLQGRPPPEEAIIMDHAAPSASEEQ